MHDERFDLHRVYIGQQEGLRNLLETGRAAATHPVAKGDGSELHWRDMLEKFLPNRYQVSKGFVIDSHGTRSEQIDAIIHDRVFSPLLWKEGDYTYVPAESVYAVFEVRQDHSPDNIKYAAQKAASVRRRFRTQAEFGWLRGPEKKDLFTPLAGLLTVDSIWNPAFGDAFYDVLGNLRGDERLDLGCALKQGSWDLKPKQDPRDAHLSLPETALISFCMHLLNRLQPLGTVGAIDYLAYESSAGLTRGQNEGYQ